MAQETIETPVVHIVDDDNALRNAVDRLCRSVGLLTRSYASAQAFLESYSGERAGCLVLDVRLPGLSGLDFQLHLAKLGIHLPVILITGHGDIQMSVRGMKAGAVDFLSKPFRDQDLLDAIAEAIERDRRRRTLHEGVERLRDRFLTLSSREQQIMMLVTAGKMNKQVAAELGISEVTVKIHRGAAMKKMAARSLTDLVRMVDALSQKSA